jgi:hypothetical protein
VSFSSANIFGMDVVMLGRGSVRYDIEEYEMDSIVGQFGVMLDRSTGHIACSD